MNVKEAYEILGLSPDCSRQEIREAYAVLSKQFHPEEHPEKFQKIHEAYVTLTRRRGGREEGANSTAASSHGSYAAAAKRGKQSLSSEIEQSGRQKGASASSANREWDFEEVLQKTEREAPEDEKGQASQEYDFERVLHENARAETQKLHEKTLAALEELKSIVVSEKRHRLKAFRAYFALPDCREVFKAPEFIKGLNDLLMQYPLKPVIYDEIIDFYRLRGMEPGQLFPEAAELYDILDQKRGMGAKKKENAFLGIPAGLAAGLWAGCKTLIRDVPILQILMLAVFAVVLAALVYKKMYENYSRTISLLAAGAVLAVLTACLAAAALV